jgi:hypothetical protein
MSKRFIFTAAALTGLMTLGATAQAWAITMPDLAVAGRSDLVRVNGHHHDHHRRGHQAHGYDGTYSDNDANGTLFKSFVMGEFTGSRKAEPRRDVD